MVPGKSRPPPGCGYPLKAGLAAGGADPLLREAVELEGRDPGTDERAAARAGSAAARSVGLVHDLDLGRRLQHHGIHASASPAWSAPGRRRARPRRPLPGSTPGCAYAAATGSVCSAYTRSRSRMTPPCRPAAAPAPSRRRRRPPPTGGGRLSTWKTAPHLRTGPPPGQPAHDLRLGDRRAGTPVQHDSQPSQDRVQDLDLLHVRGKPSRMNPAAGVRPRQALRDQLAHELVRHQLSRSTNRLAPSGPAAFPACTASRRMSPVDTCGTPSKVLQLARLGPLADAREAHEDDPHGRETSHSSRRRPSAPPPADAGPLHEPLVVAHDQLRLDLLDRVHGHADDDQQRGARRRRT